MNFILAGHDAAVYSYSAFGLAGGQKGSSLEGLDLLPMALAIPEENAHI